MLAQYSQLVWCIYPQKIVSREDHKLSLNIIACVRCSTCILLQEMASENSVRVIGSLIMR